MCLPFIFGSIFFFFFPSIFVFAAFNHLQRVCAVEKEPLPSLPKQQWMTWQPRLLYSCCSTSPTNYRTNEEHTAAREFRSLLQVGDCGLKRDLGLTFVASAFHSFSPGCWAYWSVLCVPNVETWARSWARVEVTKAFYICGVLFNQKVKTPSWPKPPQNTQYSIFPLLCTLLIWLVHF